MAFLAVALSGCGDAGSTPHGAFVGRSDAYDYSPSVIQTGDQLQAWWCGDAKLPGKGAQLTDNIFYATVDARTGKRTDPTIVLSETAGSWDAAFTCNPRVIRGSFVNPLSDGVTYTYAMYYVGTADSTGINNSVGVAFSNDGTSWNKYKDPVIVPTGLPGYGIGQPVVYNADGKSRLVLLYEITTDIFEHIKATSTDGVHFAVEGKVTRNGLDPDNPAPTWGDIGFDLATRTWYATYNLPWRDPATTGGATELGQYGTQLYSIPDSSLVSGATPWQHLKTIDTNTTGYESNFLSGLLKDQFGNVNIGAYPTIQLYPSIANPIAKWNDSPRALGEAGGSVQWDIGAFSWKPGGSQMTLTRYRNTTGYNTTSGFLDPSAHFVVDAVLGHLEESRPAGGVAFYGCKNNSSDYFVSLDPTCAGHYIVGLEGYGYATASAQATVAAYSCSSPKLGHFVSKDSQCEGSGAGSLLGYILP